MSHGWVGDHSLFAPPSGVGGGAEPGGHSGEGGPHSCTVVCFNLTVFNLFRN